MTPFMAVWVSAAVIAGYVILSAELLATYTSQRMAITQWMIPTPQRRTRRFLWLDLPLVALIVGLAHFLILTIAADSSQPSLTRVVALVELVLAVTWSVVVARRLVSGRGND